MARAWVAGIQRIAVAVLVAGALASVLLTLPEMHRVPADLPRRFEAVWINPAFAVYASALAVFVVWKVGRRPEGRYLGLLLACIAVVMAIKTVPSGVVQPWRVVVFSACWVGAFVQGLRFWSTFPRAMDTQEVAELAARDGSSLLDRANRLSASVAGAVLGRLYGRAAFGLGAIGFALLMAAPGPTTWWTPAPSADSRLLGGFDTSAPVVGVPLTLAALATIAVSAAFAYTGYRLADREQRRQVLWIVVAQITITFWSVMSVLLVWLSGLAPSGPVAALNWFFGHTTHGVVWFVNLTGFALAIFHAGAFDLRPLINKTTLYGASLISLTVVFAGVEQIVQSQVLARFDLPSGLGAWLGASAVAMVMGPIHNRLQGAVRRVGASLEPPEPDAR